MSYVCTGARVFVPGLTSRNAETIAWKSILERHIRDAYGEPRPLCRRDMLYRVLAFTGSSAATWSFDKPALFLEVVVGSVGTEKRLVVTDKRIFEHGNVVLHEALEALISIAFNNKYYSIELPMSETEEIELDAETTLELFGFQLTAHRIDSPVAASVYHWYLPRDSSLAAWPPQGEFPHK